MTSAVDRGLEVNNNPPTRPCCHKGQACQQQAQGPAASLPTRDTGEGPEAMAEEDPKGSEAGKNRPAKMVGNGHQSGSGTATSTRISGGSYLRESSSLFLNAATIITETSKQEEERIYNEKFNRKATVRNSLGQVPKRKRERSRTGLLLCPTGWYSVPPTSHVGEWSWKMFFFCCCLPACYPCYVSRTIRRRGKEEEESLGSRRFRRTEPAECIRDGSIRSHLSSSKSKQHSAATRISVDVMFLVSHLSDQVVGELEPLLRPPEGVTNSSAAEGKSGEKPSGSDAEFSAAVLDAILEENRGRGEENSDESPVILRKRKPKPPDSFPMGPQPTNSSLTPHPEEAEEVETEEDSRAASASPPTRPADLYTSLASIKTSASERYFSTESLAEAAPEPMSPSPSSMTHYYSLEPMSPSPSSMTHYYSLPLTPRHTPGNQPEASRCLDSYGSISSEQSDRFFDAEESLSSSNLKYGSATGSLAAGSLTSGSGKYHSAAGSLTSGSEKYHSVSGSLASGSGKYHSVAGSLTSGSGKYLSAAGSLTSGSGLYGSLSSCSDRYVSAASHLDLEPDLGSRHCVIRSEQRNAAEDSHLNTADAAPSPLQPSSHEQSHPASADQPARSLSSDQDVSRTDPESSCRKYDDSTTVPPICDNSSRASTLPVPAPGQLDSSESDTSRIVGQRRRKLAAGGSLPPSIMANGGVNSGPDGDSAVFKVPAPPPRPRAATMTKVSMPDEMHKTDDADKGSKLTWRLRDRWKPASQVSNPAQAAAFLRRENSWFPHTIGTANKDLEDQRLAINIIKEGNLSSWKARDIRDSASTELPCLHMVVAVYSREEELHNIITKECGMLAYIREYWSGYFPLLLIQISQDQLEPKESLPAIFSNAHRIFLTENINGEFILETIARFFLHEHIFQCSQNQVGWYPGGSLNPASWSCPGFCHLTSRPASQPSRKGTKEGGFFKSVRKTINLRRMTSQMSQPPAAAEWPAQL